MIQLDVNYVAEI